MPPTRVLIADDHALFAEALEAILAVDGRIVVVGRAVNGEQAVELAASLRPDVILMDISMPVMDGIEATQRIVETKPDTRVLVLTGSDSPRDIDNARRAGAAGYVTKDRIAAELVQAIVDASAS
jgi:DNA-binding NarL/FixJ family response regulator